MNTVRNRADNKNDCWNCNNKSKIPIKRLSSALWSFLVGFFFIPLYNLPGAKDPFPDLKTFNNIIWAFITFQLLSHPVGTSWPAEFGRKFHEYYKSCPIDKNLRSRELSQQQRKSAWTKRRATSRDQSHLERKAVPQSSQKPRVQYPRIFFPVLQGFRDARTLEKRTLMKKEGWKEIVAGEWWMFISYY